MAVFRGQLRRLSAVGYKDKFAPQPWVARLGTILGATADSAQVRTR